MDTDLEIIVKDTNIVLTPSNIKAYILMTLQGLEYMHNNWFLHRVSSLDFVLHHLLQLIFNIVAALYQIGQCFYLFANFLNISRVLPLSLV